jgi:periplasmic protein CpxP/Spy
MKKAIFLLIAVAFASIYTASAQGGGGGNFQRRTPEEQLKAVKEKLSDLKLTPDQATKSDSAFMKYFRTRDKVFEEMRAGGGQIDRDAMREKNQKLTADRDDELKKIFDEAQFKKWKDEIEPSLRPQRGGGGGGNRN